MNDIWDKTKFAAMAAWSRTTRRMRIVGAFLVLFIFTLYLSFPTIREVDYPRFQLDYDEAPRSPYNASKVALLIENRPMPILAPLMLHFMSVVPPDWRFRFMGSSESVMHLNKSMAIREQVTAGKLDLTYIPSNMSTAGQEMISRFLTNLWLYETVLQPAEWLLVFQTDSILCANSRQNLNDYLDYDWIGAPWHPNARFGGNGGLSLRRVSSIIEILRDQVRVDGSEPEDVWLAERLGYRPGARMANGTISLTFSGEAWTGKKETVDKHPKPQSDNDSRSSNNSTQFQTTGDPVIDAARAGGYVAGIDDWREGFYEPMGYHTGGGGSTLHGSIWGSPELRKHIWDYCPEVKMTLAMDAAKYVPGGCNANWKRDMSVSLGDDADHFGYGTEIIDGVEYPVLPPTLQAW